MRLSEVIKTAREEQGLSQAEFAEKVGAANGTVAGWEQGTYSPRIRRLKTIAKVLRVPYEDLLALVVKEAA